MSPDTHLVYDEYRREGHMGILDVKSDGFTMEQLKNGITRVVDKYEFLNLFLVNTWPNRDKSNSHLYRIYIESTI